MNDTVGGAEDKRNESEKETISNFQYVVQQKVYFMNSFEFASIWIQRISLYWEYLCLICGMSHAAWCMCMQAFLH